MEPISRRWTLLMAAAPWMAAALAGAPPTATIAPFTAATGAQPPAPWRVTGLPGKPLTRFEMVEVEGQRALRIHADKSYGNLVHAWQGPAATLTWRWRLDQPLPYSDLRKKNGDDVALKVCLLFDLPLEALLPGERIKLRIARTLVREAIPGATLCYVWDAALPVGTELPNAFTLRQRYIVLNSGPGVLRQWISHQRDIAADFRRAFGHESPGVPPLVGVLVGADADNTASTSTGYLSDLSISP